MDIETVRQDVDTYIRMFYEQRIVRGDMADVSYGDLWRTLQDVTFAGGKRLRPYLLVMAYLACGGAAYDQAIPIAAAQELLHISLLIHDDIIDKDFTRHGQDNVSGVMRKRYGTVLAPSDAVHYANSAALLGGDLLLTAAHSLIVSSELEAMHKISALKELDEALFYAGAGQLLDMESAVRLVGEVDPLRVAEFKTARYSFVAPLRTGALIAGATMQEVSQIETFGISLGIAYQLADDLLGMFGDETLTGKSTVSDIREGKRTVLIVRALAVVSDTERKILRNALGNASLTTLQADQVRTIIDDSGTLAYVKEIIASYVAQATVALETLTISHEARLAFSQLITAVVERTH